MPEEIVFRTKPQIAVELIDRALANGVRVSAWTCDELYGRDTKFLNALEVLILHGAGHDWLVGDAHPTADTRLVPLSCKGVPTIS